jgi:tetratricopeptide (TPR) repeat protein
VHESKGDVDQAVPWYQRLTKVDLSYIQPWAWMGLGRCYELAGKPDQAREAYQRFLADFPNHPKAPEVRALISKISHNAPPESGKKNGASEKPPVGEKPGEETGP